MTSNLPPTLKKIAYERAARDYMASLPLEHFMEATAQATQREITLASLALVKVDRPDLNVFNELLIQYPRRRRRKLGQVVPDNMVVVTDEQIGAQTSYNLPFEPAGPLWVLEYVSKNNQRKDYKDSFRKYERELQVPYYLVFHPEKQSLILYGHNKRKYVNVKPNVHDRYPIPELDLEAGLLDGWVRYWYKGKLLPLPGDLLRQLNEIERQLEREKHRAEQEKHRAEQEKHRAEELQQRLAVAERELARLRARPERT